MLEGDRPGDGNEVFFGIDVGRGRVAGASIDGAESSNELSPLRPRRAAFD
jgi:hypothetical protein